MTIRGIASLWRQHREAEFPAERGREIEGIDLVLFDATISGCVDTFVHHGGRLDVQRTAILGRCYRDAHVVVPALTGESRTYFARLESMARQILEALSGDGAEA